MLFRRGIDVTAVLAVSILSFPNIFSSGNLLVLIQCNFNDIDVNTDTGTTGTISFGNLATTQINMNKGFPQ